MLDSAVTSAAAATRAELARVPTAISAIGGRSDAAVRGPGSLLPDLYKSYGCSVPWGSPEWVVRKGTLPSLNTSAVVVCGETATGKERQLKTVERFHNNV